jgi:L-iditol 2-dehydrogenase
MKTISVYFTDTRKLLLKEAVIGDPKEDEIQIKMLANGICMFEVHDYNNQTDDVNRIQGHEGIAVVTKVGKSVSHLQEGDAVAGYLPWTQYNNVSASQTVKLLGIPKDPSIHMVEPASCSVNAIDSTNIYPGTRAVVFGAGYMGLLLVQMLARTPLAELIVIDMKRDNLDLALQYGADSVIDISTEDGLKTMASLEEDSFDFCFECTGAEKPLTTCTQLIRRGGTINIHSFHHVPRSLDVAAWHVKGVRVINSSPGVGAGYYPFRAFEAADVLMAKGKIDQTQLITHRFTLNDIEEAMNVSSARADGFIKSVLLF